jgi:hypothetical protein
MAIKYKVPLNLAGIGTDPSNQPIGSIYYNTVSNKIRVLTDIGWQNASVDLTAAGNTSFYSPNAPSDLQGTDGDVYFDTQSLTVYRKLSGTWGSGTEVNVYVKAEVDQLISDVEAIALAGL